jgi:3-oxoacyl-[acyl-carrier protein] reductase
MRSVNRVAIVTGGSRGIGRGISLELSRIGYDLVINYAGNEEAARESSRLAKLAASRDDVRAEIFQADISIAEERKRLIDFTREKFGRLDLLVNNAGIAPKKRIDLLEATEESFDRLIGVNLKAPYLLSQLAARWMIEERKVYTEYHPAIIFVSSISAYAATTERADYCIAKSGLAMVTKLFAARLADEGINVFEIRPGIIETDMTAPVKSKYDPLIEAGISPIRRWGRPEDVGRAVAAIANESFPFSTGEVLNVDGGFHLKLL